jgi:hypothetical protein
MYKLEQVISRQHGNGVTTMLGKKVVDADAGTYLISSRRRVLFASGRLLTTDDFQTEQEYFLARHRLHNRYLHGWGIASGLRVSVDGSSLHLEPGCGIDCVGDELIVPEPITVPLPPQGETVYVCLAYSESEVDNVPAPGDSDEMIPSRVEEKVTLTFDSADACAGHQKSCGTRHLTSFAAVNSLRRSM